MSDEVENTTPTGPEAAEVQKPNKKSGLIKYALLGLIGVAVVVVIAFGTLMLMGSGETPSSSAEEATDSTHVEASSDGHDGHAETPENHAKSDSLSIEDSLLALMEEDASVLDEIMQNLEVLDYEPSESELEGEQVGMSVEDSIEAVNWLEQEKKRLTERESELNAREKKLKALDAKLSKQILRIEQAESSRISKLAKLYDGMEARSVAQLMANLDDETVVALLPRMKSKTASQVLALLPPKRAAKLYKQMIKIAEK